MKRLLLTILFASFGLAQIPSDVMRVKLAERDTPQKRFMRDNPGAVEIRRDENATHFRKADGTFVAIFGKGLNYVDSESQIQPVAPELWETDAGFRQIGVASPIRIITTSQNQDTIEIWNGSRVASATTSKLTRTGAFTWTFPWTQITWTLEVQPEGWRITSEPIAASRGSRTYQMPLASTGLNPVPDAAGNLSDGTFTITRPVMVRADDQRTPCSAWTVGPKSVNFTCDDTSFPPAAYPYIIDPTGTYSIAASADDGHVSRQTASWPVYNLNPTALTTDTVTRASDSYSGGSYLSNQTFFRWDTSGITTGNTVVSASLSLTTAAGYVSTNGCAMYFDWIDAAAIWPIGAEDWIPNANQTGNARSGDLVDAFPTTNQTYVLPLSNVSNVNRSGYTALRYGIRCASQPTGSNYNRFYTFDYGTPAYRPTLTVVYGRPPATVSATPNSGSIVAGTWNTFTFQVSDPDGYADIQYYHLQLSAGPAGTPGIWDTNACFLLIGPNSNVLYLRKDDNTEPWLGGYTFGSANFVENSQCRIDYANSTLTNSGTTSTATIRMLLKPTFSAGGWTKHIYVWVLDSVGFADGWDDYGSWTLIPGGPKMIVVQQ